MDAKNMTRKSGRRSGAGMALLASAAVISFSLSACTTSAAPRADVSFAKAQKAMENGKTTKAIEHAEAAVLADPRNAAYRALLGKVYLEAGRYTSASMSFGDALELGDRESRTVLTYALTQTAIGDGKNALDTLMRYESVMDPADLGLALALAGNPERGVFVLTNTLRAGQNTPKVRQNLAYTYALAGNWRAARVMAAEDVPADQLDKRLSDWASKAKPEDHLVRVADLIGIAPVADDGMPTTLALANFPSAQQLMAQAKSEGTTPSKALQIAAAPGQSKTNANAMKANGSTANAPLPPANQPIATAAAKPVTDKIAAIMAATNTKTPAPAKVAAKSSASPEEWGASQKPRPIRSSGKTVQPTGPSFVSRPVTQELPASSAPVRVTALAQPSARKVPANAPKAPQGDSHLVQLGSYGSEADAKANWASLKRKYSQLAAHDVVITKAEVNGKIYYRVAAAGFGRQSAAQMCSSLKSAGGGCFAYAASSPPKGAVDNGTRIAAASR